MILLVRLSLWEWINGIESFQIHTYDILISSYILPGNSTITTSWVQNDDWCLILSQSKIFHPKKSKVNYLTLLKSNIYLPILSNLNHILLSLVKRGRKGFNKQKGSLLLKKYYLQPKNAQLLGYAHVSICQ